MIQKKCQARNVRFVTQKCHFVTKNEISTKIADIQGKRNKKAKDGVRFQGAEIREN